MFRNVLKVVLVVLILALPVTAQGAGFGNTKKQIKSISSFIPKQGLSIDPDDYPQVTDGQYIGSLEDYYGYQYITFKTISDYGTNQMNLQLKYHSDYTYLKASIATVEFYKDNNGSFDFQGQTVFDTSGKNDQNLNSYLKKSDYTNKQYIYVRFGISETKNNHDYSDTLLFKVKNPYYKNEVASTPVQQKGKYAIISNESVLGNQTEYTGSFKMNDLKYSIMQNADPGAYKVDVNMPFTIPKNNSNLLKKYSFVPNMTYKIGDQKDFWVTNIATGDDYQIDGSLMYTGTKTNVWVYNHLISPQDAVKLGTEFDKKIYPTITTYFAKESDVDRDGRINILCYDIQDGFSGSGGYVAGYFWAKDLYNIAHSNQSEIFYIDTYPAMGDRSSKDVTAAYETLAHEFQHMVNFNQNVLIEGSEEAMDTWLDEGLSMAAEQVYSGKILTDRINYYNTSKAIAMGQSLLDWNEDGDLLANYSLSYLFSQYVKLQANKGDSIFKEVLLDRNNNYKAIEDIVHKYIHSSMSFGKFLTDFRAALLLKQDTGLYGFKGISGFDQLKPRFYSGAGTNLKSGGAIVKQINSQEFVVPENKGTDITYTFLDNDSKADTTSPDKPIVNEVKDYDKKVTGKAEAYSKVTVKTGSTILGYGTTDQYRNYTVTLKTAQKAETVLSVTATDKTGNVSTAAKVTVKDKTAPGAPVVNEVKDYDKKVTGKAEVNSKVTVKIARTTIGYVTTNKYGNFTVTLKTAQKAGTVLLVFATDKAGNSSKTTQVVVKDKTAPATPKVNKVTVRSTVVTGKAEANSTVFVMKGNRVNGKSTASKNGNFTVKIAKQKKGTILYVYAKDKGGNSSKNVKITILK